VSVAPALASVARRRVRVEGVVQGVGFRPHVFRLAHEEGLAGWVLNDERGVLIEAEGEESALERFLARLTEQAPPLAEVERLTSERIPPIGASVFEIVESSQRGAPDALVSPDTATCDACLAELFDPTDRRFRYPFINCTNCGPRFTIVRGVPYDRPLTTMAGFEMCERCEAEYRDPGDRRFHAQPNACPACGPAVHLADREGRTIDVVDPVAATAAALNRGLVVAVKGIGGFHLAARGDDDAAVAKLRARKHREDKPFALMVGELEAARELVELGPEDERLLASRERPILLARRRAAGRVADAVAPRSRELGLMLPYSPLHHLLLADAGTPLVMTSGNVSDEPIAYRDADAVERLRDIADLFLSHDRPIQTRTDDSVVRVVRARPLMLRRSRGYVPQSLPLRASRQILACGAELKSTFCLARGGRAWVGHHIGDLSNFETLLSFEEGVEHLERLFAVSPEVIAHDLHPDYLSTRYALGREATEHVAVQHHHAHLAACLAEHGADEAAVGAIYDGTGYGADGSVWGGELLVGDQRDYDRAGHLWPVRLPGGDRAAMEPWRMACAWLVAATGPDPELPASLRGDVEPRDWRMVAQMAHRGVSAPLTTSMGRLCDAAAALCGVRSRVAYEGQAAIELEAAADPRERRAYRLIVRESAGRVVLDARPTIRALAADVAAGERLGTMAARFHNAVARATAYACATVALARGLDTVVLSGGVFQNRLLLEGVGALLDRCGLRVLMPERLPPNDGGIAFGQAAVAAARVEVRR
jgi:hydrogenase maturation protein HypF